MRGHFGQHSLGRRIIAFAAAYIIALSTTIAAFAAAQAAVDAIVDPLGVICHNVDAGGPSRSGDDGNARHCIDNCTVCGLTLAASPPQAAPLHRVAVPAPPAKPFTVLILVGRADLKSHRSRAPPRAA